MSLSTPILLTPPAFDATKSYTFSFNVVSGDQVVANMLIIRDNSDNSVVYSEKQTSFRYEHILPPNTLENGKYYNAQVVTYNSSGQSSSNSNIIQFYCYTTPELSIINLTSGSVVTGSSFNLEIEYDQKEKEILNTYNVILYDQSLTPIFNSGLLYANSSEVPLTLKYTITELENGNFYYVSVTGTTINDTIISTPNYNFTVNYYAPSVLTLLQLTNNCDGGFITVRSNISSIPGTVIPPPPIYIEDSEIDLTDAMVIWNKDFVINGDFTCLIKGRKLNNYSNIITFKGQDESIVAVDYMLGYDDSSNFKSYARLRVYNDKRIYEIFSPYQDVPKTEETPVYIWFRRIGNLYEIYLTVENEGG